MSNIVDRMRRIERNAILINHYSSLKTEDGRPRVQFNDLIEQVKADAVFVENELANMQKLWEKVKPVAKAFYDV
jgi:hypothetical protein